MQPANFSAQASTSGMRMPVSLIACLTTSCSAGLLAATSRLTRAGRSSTPTVVPSALIAARRISSLALSASFCRAPLAAITRRWPAISIARARAVPSLLGTRAATAASTSAPGVSTSTILAAATTSGSASAAAFISPLVGRPVSPGFDGGQPELLVAGRCGFDHLGQCALVAPIAIAVISLPAGRRRLAEQFEQGLATPRT